MVIIIDTREKTPLDFHAVETTVAKLDTGDYSLAGFEDQICIERKSSISELWGNIVEKRFWAELERMQQFKHRFLLLEFNFDDILRFPIGSDIPRRRWRYLRVKPPFVIKRLAEIQVDYNVPVIFAGSRENAAQIVLAILRRFDDSRQINCVR